MSRRDTAPGEPTFHYNLACSYSLLGELDAAFGALDRAIELGYDEVDHLRRDPDLENLRGDRRYHQILRKLAEGNVKA